MIMDFPIRIRVLWLVIIALVCVSFFNSLILARIYAQIFSGQAFTKFTELDVGVKHKMIVEQFYEDRKFMSVSHLGAILYKNEKYPEISASKLNKSFVILMWKHWNKLRMRHLFNFRSEQQDPFKDCSVKNCIVSGRSHHLGSADAVVVNLLRGQLPTAKHRKPWQRWIFLNDESPENTFNLAKKRMNFADLKDLFNWSMTYMSDSDIPVPYGRMVPLQSPIYSQPDPPIQNLVPNWAQKTWEVPAAILMSSCRVSYRNKLISSLKDYIQIDVFGACGEREFKTMCPGYFTKDCEAISQYLFYLVFENGKCTEYMTEKLFHNAYSKGAIPIIQGPTLQDCQKFLPPNSYLHVDSYEDLKDLAEDIKKLIRNEKELLQYHIWRNHFEIKEEHGYFGTKSVHLCRICEALNYNSDENVVYGYNQLEEFLNPATLCRDYDNFE